MGGAVERGGFIDGSNVEAGDVAIAIPSVGVHSNGFSLVRRIVEDAGLDYAKPAPFDPNRSLGSALLTPTRIYAKASTALARAGVAKGMAHITGGGLSENPQRAFPKHLALDLDMNALAPPPVFDWLQETGEISRRDMTRTFNCGIGLLAYVDSGNVETALRVLGESGADDAVVCGKIVERGDGPSVLLSGREEWRN